MFKSVGRLIYDPNLSIGEIEKHEPWWLILKTGEGIVRYYRHWLKKHYDVQFEHSVWGSHISVNRGVPAPRHWGKKQGKHVSFQYTERVYLVNEIFFCVDAYSKHLEDIRQYMGLSRLPNCGFHLTIGRLNKEYMFKHSNRFAELKTKQNVSNLS